MKICLLTILLFIKVATTFGQTKKDKIIFLTDVYNSYVAECKTDNKNLDSIYKVNVHTAIYDTHFQKSEYAFIVKDFFARPIKNIAELSKSIDRITINQDKIKSKIIGALKKSNQKISNDGLTIYIVPSNFDSRNTMNAMTGIMGLTAGSKQIILTIEPDIVGWENMLEYAVAHEFNHAYYTNMNFGKSAKWTLLDYLVFEGRGDSFAHLLYPKVVTPWTKALNENQKIELWNKVKTNLQSEDLRYQREVMFGSKNYPVWGGYSLGFEIVQKALIRNKKLKPSIWTNLSSDKILELSEPKD